MQMVAENSKLVLITSDKQPGDRKEVSISLQNISNQESYDNNNTRKFQFGGSQILFPRSVWKKLLLSRILSIDFPILLQAQVPAPWNCAEFIFCKTEQNSRTICYFFMLWERKGSQSTKDFWHHGHRWFSTVFSMQCDFRSIVSPARGLTPCLHAVHGVRWKSKTMHGVRVHGVPETSRRNSRFPIAFWNAVLKGKSCFECRKYDFFRLRRAKHHQSYFPIICVPGTPCTGFVGRQNPCTGYTGTGFVKSWKKLCSEVRTRSLLLFWFEANWGPVQNIEQKYWTWQKQWLAGFLTFEKTRLMFLTVFEENNWNFQVFLEKSSDLRDIFFGEGGVWLRTVLVKLWSTLVRVFDMN